MKPITCALLAFVSTLFRSRLALQLEIVALRHQFTVYQRTTNCRWGWIVLNRDRCGHRLLERSCIFQKSVAYKIITNG